MNRFLISSFKGQRLVHQTTEIDLRDEVFELKTLIQARDKIILASCNSLEIFVYTDAKQRLDGNARGLMVRSADILKRKIESGRNILSNIEALKEATKNKLPQHTKAPLSLVQKNYQFDKTHFLDISTSTHVRAISSF